MITNNIMMKLKNKEDADKVRAILEGMLGKIDTLLDVKVHLNAVPRPASYDLLYVSTFPDREGQQAYIVHPVHEQAGREIGQYVESMVMVAYES